jgi:peptidoglycan/LPS O-acetylase OafA/YrhL
MAESDSSPSVAAGPGFPRVALGLAWTCSALATAVVGWLLFAISERDGDRVAGGILLGVAALGLLAALAVASNKRRAQTLGFSMAVSVVFVVGGIVAAVVAVAGGNPFAGDLLLIGGVPVVGGVVTGLLGRRARTMAG